MCISQHSEMPLPTLQDSPERWHRHSTFLSSLASGSGRFKTHALFWCLAGFCGARWWYATSSCSKRIREGVKCKEEAPGWSHFGATVFQGTELYCLVTRIAKTGGKQTSDRDGWLVSNGSYLLSLNAWKYKECQTPVFSAQTSEKKLNPTKQKITW